MVSSLVNDVTMTSTLSAMTVGETITFYSDSGRTTKTASGTLQSYVTTAANNFTINAITGTIATGHYVTGSVSGNTAGSVSDAGGFRTGEVTNGLSGDSKANGNITAVATSMPTLSTTLVADVHGVLTGEFEIPANTFKSIEKLFRLTESSTDSGAS